jgi:hypothetical protein
VGLPPQLNDLLNKLVPKGGVLPTPQQLKQKLPGAGLDQQQTNQLLDFLLSP